MTTMTTRTTRTSRTTTSTRGGAAGVGAATGLVATALMALFAHDWGEIAISGAVIAVSTAGIFGYVVPRALRKESAGGTALGLAIPAFLLTMPAFWIGLPLVLGVAGLIVGNAGRQARAGAGKCIVAVVLGALAVLGYLAIYVASWIAGETGFLLD